MLKAHSSLYLGSSTRSLFPIGLGARPLSDHKLGPKSIDQILLAHIEAGGNFVDTADVYSTSYDDIGHNERIIAESLRRLGINSKQMVIATKGGYQRPDEKNWVLSNNSQWIRFACERSLQQLGQECIELYFLHGVAIDVDIEAMAGILGQLQHEGKIAHIGLSNIDLEQLKKFQQYIPIQAIQNRYNLLFKGDASNGLIEYCQKNRISYFAFSPLCGHEGQRYLINEPILRHLSSFYEATPQQMILAWLKQQGVIPIPGASSYNQVKLNMASVNINITQEHTELLNSISDKVDYYL